MPTAGSDYDIVLNSVGYMLALDPDTQAPRFAESVAPTVQPQPMTDTGAVLTGRDPSDEYVVAYIPDLSGGFGAGVYDAARPNRYNIASGLYASEPGHWGEAGEFFEVGLGWRSDEANPGDAGWTLTGMTLTTPGDEVGTDFGANPLALFGNRKFSFASLDTGDTGYVTLANPTAFQGKAITVEGMFRTGPSGTAPDMRLFIQDSVATSNSAQAVVTAAYAARSVTRTIDAGATFVRVGVECMTGAGATCRLDGLRLYDGSSAQFSNFAMLGTDMYVGYGSLLLKWDNTNTKWDVVYIAAARIKSLTTWGTNVFAALGGANAFVYGSGTTWTLSTLAGDSKFADFFATSMDRVGNDVVVRGLIPNTVGISANPINGGTDWSLYTIGESDKDITGVYPWRDTTVAGKEDGLFLFQTNHFVNVTQEFTVAPSASNFSKGQEFGGALYLVGANDTLWVLSPGSLDGPINARNIQNLNASPLGTLGAIASDGNHLYLLNDHPQAAGTNYQYPNIIYSRDGETWHMTLVGMRNDDGTQASSDWPTGTENFNIHKMSGLNKFHSAARFSNNLFVTGVQPTLLGASAYGVAGRLTLSTGVVPYRVATFKGSQVVNLLFPRIDGGFPEEQKSFKTVRLTYKHSTTPTATLYYRTDTTSTWTSAGAGTITNKVHSWTLTNISDKWLELSVEITDLSSTSLEATSLLVLGTLRPVARRRLSAWVKIGQHLPTYAGEDVSDTATLYSNLGTALDSADPVTLVFTENFLEGDPTTKSYSVYVRNLVLDSFEANPSGGWTRVYRVDMVEA